MGFRLLWYVRGFFNSTQISRWHAAFFLESSSLIYHRAYSFLTRTSALYVQGSTVSIVLKNFLTRLNQLEYLLS